MILVYLKRSTNYLKCIILKSKSLEGHRKRDSNVFMATRLDWRKETQAREKVTGGLHHHLYCFCLSVAQNASPG